MKTLATADEMRSWSWVRRAEGQRIGFVPTMGFLHEGHLSLVDLAAQHSDTVVVSIFVNPTQFNRSSDLESYPRDMKRDLALLEQRSVAAVYLPSAVEMYPEGFASWVSVEGLTELMEGAKRPGHFKGVATVVSKLFHAVQPDVAVFGQKDAQQAAVIQRMTRDLDFGIEILLGPTQREEDGLAMSSRNVNLTSEHRRQASVLFQALGLARQRFDEGEREVSALTSLVRETIADRAPDGRVDYVEVADRETLHPVNRIESKALMALAVYFGEVRLIDNVLLGDVQ